VQEPLTLPLCDLAPGLLRDREALVAAMDEVLASGRFVLGPFVERFERELARYLGVDHVIGVASGTDAIELALRALGVEKGEGVITTPFTFVATAEAVVHAGAVPIFADVLSSDLTLDLSRVDEELTRLPLGNDGRRRLPDGTRISAIVPVHLFGSVVPFSALSDLAGRHRLLVVEDTAQALGASRGTMKAGAMGDAGCFSFFPAKTLGALGDGGAIAVRRSEAAEELRALRQHGLASRSDGPRRLGRNSRLDALQAAFLSVRLRRLEEDIGARRLLLAAYGRALEGLSPDVIPLFREVPEGHGAQHAIVRARDRDRLAQRLSEHGIGTAIYYRTPLHLTAPFRHAARLGTLEQAVIASREVLALPLFPGMPEDAVARVTAVIAGHHRLRHFFFGSLAGSFAASFSLAASFAASAADCFFSETCASSFSSGPSQGASISCSNACSTHLPMGVLAYGSGGTASWIFPLLLMCSTTVKSPNGPSAWILAHSAAWRSPRLTAICAPALSNVLALRSPALSSRIEASSFFFAGVAPSMGLGSVFCAGTSVPKQPASTPPERAHAAMAMERRMAVTPS
jgi:dTDP-4-amino-4,6-dideoxygalactose transaminase